MDGNDLQCKASVLRKAIMTWNMAQFSGEEYECLLRMPAAGGYTEADYEWLKQMNSKVRFA